MQDTRFLTALKILSIIAIIGGVFSLITAILFFVGGGALSSASAGDIADITSQTGLDQTQITGITLGIGAAAFISGAIDILRGILGLRAAKDPMKIKPVWILAIIGLVLGVINAIFTLGTGVTAENIGTALGTLVGSGLMFWIANTIKTQANV